MLNAPSGDTLISAGTNPAATIAPIAFETEAWLGRAAGMSNFSPLHVARLTS